MRSGPPRVRFWIAFVLAQWVASALSACGSDSTRAEEPVPTFPPGPAMSSGFFMGIEMPGRLQQKGACLVMSTKDGLVVPVWPSGYTIDRHRGGLMLYDQEGRVVAGTGQRVIVSGGEIDLGDLGSQPCLDAAPRHFEVQHLRLG